MGRRYLDILRLGVVMIVFVMAWASAPTTTALGTDYVDYPFPPHMHSYPSFATAIDDYIPPAYDNQGTIVGCRWYPFASKYAPYYSTKTVNGTNKCEIDTYKLIKELAAANPNTEPKAFKCYNYFQYYLDAKNPKTELCCVGCFIHEENGLRNPPSGGSSSYSQGVLSRGSAMAAAFTGMAMVAAQWLLMTAHCM